MNQLSSFIARGEGGGLTGVLFFLIMFLIWLAVVAAILAGAWKTFVKAGKPGWAAIIPIYNWIVIFEMTGRPVWWIALFFIPFAGIVFVIIGLIDLAKSFGQSTGFGLGLFFLAPIFWPILGFGKATYQGPSVTA